MTEKKSEYLTVGFRAWPCPFCSSRDLFAGYISAMSLGVQCNGCGAQVYREFGDDGLGLEFPDYERHVLAKAVNAWNTRGGVNAREVY